MPGSRVSEEEKERIIKRRNEGETYGALAKEFSRSVCTIVKVVKDSSGVEAEFNEVDEFQKSLQKLEDKFPGAIDRIRRGGVQVVSTVKVVKYD
jgi:hypothetical protein